MEFRIEHDTMGDISVPMKHYWGAQTQRSCNNFAIGTELMPAEIIKALALVKYAAAKVNCSLGKMTNEKSVGIILAAEKIIQGNFEEEFPLKVWQTGSGTQTNMNLNEVIAHIAKENNPEMQFHPNDDVNMSQSSNDVFPTAMHIAALQAITEHIYPAIDELIMTCRRLEEENANSIKIGRTHLQDAVPLSFAQEVSGWRGMLEENIKMIRSASEYLKNLAIGGTAVGTGVNCPVGFDLKCVEIISEYTGIQFYSETNKFHALTSKDAYVYVHGALKALAANLMKIANDVRWLASGPRCGLGEISIPANEPGSSIMPGKVNPTQCEAVTMVAVQVMGNDAVIGFAASQGNFQLNVFMPVLAYNMLQSIRLLGDVMRAFNNNCFSGIKVNDSRMKEFLDQSLMIVTYLAPMIGYEKAAFAAKKAFNENRTLKETVLELKLMTEEEYANLVQK